jgi:hypothetical protein
MMNMFAYSFTNRASFPTLPPRATFVKFYTLLRAFDICVTFFFVSSLL